MCDERDEGCDECDEGCDECVVATDGLDSFLYLVVDMV